jgi:uncharacterized Zn finger protein (UPF0148 family)
LLFMTKYFCTSCGAELMPGKEFCPKCLIRVVVVVPNVPTVSISPVAESKKQYLKDTPDNRAKNLKEYKVIGVEQGLFEGPHFNKKNLEKILNSYALEGWKVIEFSINNPSFSGVPTQIIIILERNMPLES